MRREYTLILASSVGDRDGMALELCSIDGTRVAEVFHDGDTGLRTMTIFNERALPIDVLDWLLKEAREQL